MAKTPHAQENDDIIDAEAEIISSDEAPSHIKGDKKPQKPRSFWGLAMLVVVLSALGLSAYQMRQVGALTQRVTALETAAMRADEVASQIGLSSQIGLANQERIEQLIRRLEAQEARTKAFATDIESRLAAQSQIAKPPSVTAPMIDDSAATMLVTALLWQAADSDELASLGPLVMALPPSPEKKRLSDIISLARTHKIADLLADASDILLATQDSAYALEGVSDVQMRADEASSGMIEAFGEWLAKAVNLRPLGTQPKSQAALSDADAQNDKAQTNKTALSGQRANQPLSLGKALSLLDGQDDERSRRWVAAATLRLSLREALFEMLQTPPITEDEPS